MTFMCIIENRPVANMEIRMIVKNENGRNEIIKHEFKRQITNKGEKVGSKIC